MMNRKLAALYAPFAAATFFGSVWLSRYLYVVGDTMPHPDPASNATRVTVIIASLVLGLFAVVAALATAVCAAIAVGLE